MSFSIPAEYLYVEDVYFLGSANSIPNVTEAWRDLNGLYRGRSILSLRTHVELMRFFDGLSSQPPEEYLDWFELIFSTRGLQPPIARHDRLVDRHDLFSALTGNRASSPEIALSPLPARYDERLGRFVLSDGHHRAAFRVARGHRHAIVSCRPDEYAYFVNESGFAKIAALVARQDRRLVYSPILHPSFAGIEACRDFETASRVHMICSTLAYSGLRSVVDIGSNTGFFSFLFAREGCDVLGIEEDASHFDLACALGEATRSTARFVRSPFEDMPLSDIGSRDMGLLLTVLYHTLRRDFDLTVEIIRRCDEVVARFLVWESGDHPRKRKR